MEVTLILVIAIFAINVYLHRPVLDSFLFSLALAVGLTPQLLPAIISINLAHGARRMAEQKVIVKRLASIENFGSMNVLCSDKTGTLTEGIVEAALGASTCDGRAQREGPALRVPERHLRDRLHQSDRRGAGCRQPGQVECTGQARRGAVRLHAQAPERPGGSRRAGIS